MFNSYQNTSQNVIVLISRYIWLIKYLFEYSRFRVIVYILVRRKKSLPLHGSFLIKNSSKAIQPPPTLTMTVDRKIRTSRNFCESPN